MCPKQNKFFVWGTLSIDIGTRIGLLQYIGSHHVKGFFSIFPTIFYLPTSNESFNNFFYFSFTITAIFLFKSLGDGINSWLLMPLLPYFRYGLDDYFSGPSEVGGLGGGFSPPNNLLKFVDFETEKGCKSQGSQE